MTGASMKTNKPGKRRAEMDLRGIDPLGYLLSMFDTEPVKEKKIALALEILPFVQPKLKTVDKRVTTEVIQLTIGGKTVGEITDAELVDTPALPDPTHAPSSRFPFAGE